MMLHSTLLFGVLLGSTISPICHFEDMIPYQEDDLHSAILTEQMTIFEKRQNDLANDWQKVRGA